MPDALWWDTADPYQFVRVEPHRDHDVVIFGGEDHKTGQEQDTEACYRRLEQHLRAIVPNIEMTHRWSGQVIETPDGLPYIGKSADHQYSASGYAGNGLTFGTLAGIVISDAILERSNPWTDLFDPNRKALTRGLWDYVKENVDYPYYLDSRSVCRRGGEIPSLCKTWPGKDHQPEWREGRRVSRPGWARSRFAPPSARIWAMA